MAADIPDCLSLTLLLVQMELTRQRAADFVQVADPNPIGVLDATKIPFRLVGQHRRARLDDLRAYSGENSENRRQVFDELAAGAQESGMRS